jgi:hypothetical protein
MLSRRIPPLADAPADDPAVLTTDEFEARARARLSFDLDEHWAEIDGAGGTWAEAVYRGATSDT